MIDNELKNKYEEIEIFNDWTLYERLDTKEKCQFIAIHNKYNFIVYGENLDKLKAYLGSVEN